MRIAATVGVDLDGAQFSALRRYKEWLIAEAIPAGGLGPDEAERIDERHIGDSLLFARGVPQATGEVGDVGSGVGLPGIPLAILWPSLEFRLIDRSGRRIDLLRRAVRVLGLENVEVAQADAGNFAGRFDVLVSRATIPPDQAFPLFRSLLKPGGVAVMGGSWRQEPVWDDWDALEVGGDVLDHPVWLLIMRRR